MEKFDQIETDILNKLKNTVERNSLDVIKTEVFGKKGVLTNLFKKIGGLEQNQKKEYASELNNLKQKISAAIEKKYIEVTLLTCRKI